MGFGGGREVAVVDYFGKVLSNKVLNDLQLCNKRLGEKEIKCAVLHHFVKMRSTGRDLLLDD
jgi:hypothetical protein